MLNRSILIRASIPLQLPEIRNGEPSSPSFPKSRVRSDAAMRYRIILALALSRPIYSATVPSTPVQGNVPVSLAPGSPDGVYRLKDFETVNLYNGQLNIALPLLSIGGR